MTSVSVILTTCDRPQMLDEALRSIRAQTFSDFDVIVCDNASDMRTADVVSVHANADPRIVYRRRAQRLSQWGNVAQGLLEARGEFLAVCHDDDAWEPEFLARLVPILQGNAEVVAAFSDHYIMDEEGRVDLLATRQTTHRWKRDDLSPGLHQPFFQLALIDQSLPTVMATVMRRSAIDLSDFPEEIGGTYDVWLAYLLSRRGGGAWYVPDRLTRYRVHKGSATARGGLELARSAVYVWTRLVNDDCLMDIRTQLSNKLSILLTNLGSALLREGQRTEARRAFIGALRRRTTWKPAAGLMLSALPARVLQRALRTIRKVT